MKTTFYITKILPRIFLVLMIGMIAFGNTSCKSKKKLAQEAAALEYADKVEKAIAELTAILNDDGTMPIVEMERRLNNIKSQNLNDSRVNDLIAQVEAKIAAEKEKMEMEAKLKEQQKQQAEEQPKYSYIEEYFSQIATAQSAGEANARISDAKKLFVSDDVPVLIIISKTIDGVDYDKPTTIDKYLNYLKDTKKNPNKVESVKQDSYGQITVIELIKK
ncbi:MAG: hypothetical protein K9G76_01740 [Bacteroidales bacterium]|nr:hypothetical protein [Bacteroidales bacterium]MCF8403276.1 hypothetical protein [Bacteroidales bacterium]